MRETKITRTEVKENDIVYTIVSHFSDSGYLSDRLEHLIDDDYNSSNSDEDYKDISLDSGMALESA